MNRTLHLLPERYAVCRESPGAELPAGLLAHGAALASLTRRGDELSLVCREQDVPGGWNAERGWRALEVEGPLDFQLTGILADLARPLADAGLTLFALSTFDTDTLLVRDDSVHRARAALTEAGHTVRG